MEKGRASVGSKPVLSLVTAAPVTAVVPDHDAEPVEVLDAGGYPVEITPGVLDDEAEYVYMNGQCIALATELSKAHGWDVVVVTHPESDQDDDGEDYERAALVHVYALTPEGDYLDIRGDHDGDGARQSDLDTHPDATFRVVQAPEVAAGALRDEFGGYVEEQNYEAAASFVEALTAYRN